MSAIKNLAIQTLEAAGETVDDYDGLCGELVDALIHKHGSDAVSIMYIKPPSMDICIQNGHRLWSYHMVAVIDGAVHDAWFPDLILPPQEYLTAAFPGQDLTSEIDGWKKETNG